MLVHPFLVSPVPLLAQGPDHFDPTTRPAPSHLRQHYALGLWRVATARPAVAITVIGRPLAAGAVEALWPALSNQND